MDRLTSRKSHALIVLLLMPAVSFSSFIESTIGTAVVNDATATLYNPSALSLLKNPQIIGLGSVAYFNSQFTGQATQAITGFTTSGTSSAQTNYFLPSFYWGMPISKQFFFGFAIVSNYFNRDIDSTSILRYAQSSNNVQDIDLVPAVGIKLNSYFSVGAGVNVSYAKFVLEPISGVPSLNIPDSQSRNDSDGTGYGGDIGLLFTPATTTTMGFNYRSAIRYHLSGTSTFEGNPTVVSHHYAFNFWTPARSVFSINHFFTSKFGVIATIQRIEWDIFQTININGIATAIGPQPLIVNAVVPYHLHNTWLLTLGTHYRLTPNWIIRIAGTYNQSPSNPNLQISTGNSVILGGSVGYQLSKAILIDGSYAHAFIRDQGIHIHTGRNMIDGVNQATRNSMSLKVTFNL